MILEDCKEYCEYLKTALDLFRRIGVAVEHLDGLKVWIGASRRDETSVKTKNLYTCVLRQLGVEILDNDFEAIVNERVKYDVILMFTLTPGTSARAIEIVITSVFYKTQAKDKLYVCMPAEYGDGYISRKLSQHLVAGKLYLRKKISFDRLDEQVFAKSVGHLIDIANYKRKEMELTFKPTIAILTALPKEFDTVRRLLAEERKDKSLGDSAPQYPHGRIGGKNVVVAMSGVGNNLSSAIAMKLYERYPSIKYTFVVGIAGGIPDYKNITNHVRLGDIVLSDEKGVLQYDNIKKTINGIETNFAPRPPDATLIRNSKIYLESIEPGNYKFWAYLDDLLGEKGIVRPADVVLDESPWLEDAHKIEVKDEACNPEKRPNIHFGAIASANTVLKDPKVRESLKTDFKAKAVEMESSGVADAAWLEGRFYFVVRGICDYANPEKNKIWQGYAAAAAAALTRELIEETLTVED